MANGLDVLSDDFLPVESNKGLVCRFPAAISIKKQAFKMLIPQYPELNRSVEYNNPILNKTFRYLQPTSSNLLSVPCKAFVFVKYKKDAGFSLTEFPQEEAIEKLIPDSVGAFLEKMKSLRTTMPKGKERMKYFDGLVEEYFSKHFK